VYQSSQVTQTLLLFQNFRLRSIKQWKRKNIEKTVKKKEGHRKRLEFQLQEKDQTKLNIIKQKT
jgi:hypothetical protein